MSEKILRAIVTSVSKPKNEVKFFVNGKIITIKNASNWKGSYFEDSNNIELLFFKKGDIVEISSRFLQPLDDPERVLFSVRKATENEKQFALIKRLGSD